MEITVTKEFSWSMSHRLAAGYIGPCAHLHGHEYKAQLTFTSDTPNEYGLIVDFVDVLRLCKGWINSVLDHGTLVYYKDHQLLIFLRDADQKHYITMWNTTVENITPFLASVFQAQIDKLGEISNAESKVILTKLRVYETSTSWCDWSI